MVEETQFGSADSPQDDFVSRVRAALEQVRPYLQMEGGDVEMVEVVGRDVKVRLLGACSGCPFSTYTLKVGIEQTLRKEIPEFGNLIEVK
ncbi:MAG: hypothetical protein B1H03_00335 [Planctomycetales bacterium 4484_113]|nr:MAG: hypothetical protein B1H03_00335 [Planctomycetales bacterium 4484_113]